jgi:hypothetical protein
VENLRRPLEIPSGFPNEINLKIQSANHLFKNQTFNIISSLFVLLNQVASGDFSPDVLRWRRFGGACRRENFWLPLHALKRLTTASPTHLCQTMHYSFARQRVPTDNLPKGSTCQACRTQVWNRPVRLPNFKKWGKWKVFWELYDRYFLLIQLPTSYSCFVFLCLAIFGVAHWSKLASTVMLFRNRDF